MTKPQALQVAEQHMRAAYKALYDAGFSPAETFEKLQGILLTLWTHVSGL